MNGIIHAEAAQYLSLQCSSDLLKCDSNRTHGSGTLAAFCELEIVWLLIFVMQVALLLIN